jgi:serine/threonine protein kinase/tetratricopeptide (TPR) repeat protein
MTNHPQSVEELFEAALSLPPEEREGFLDRACAGAPILRHLMDQLIEEEGLPESFLRSPALEEEGSERSRPDSRATPSPEVPPRFAAGELIANRFEVVRFISRGGMGEVYEVQDRFLQGTSVALKIIRPHIAADPYSSRRFEQEVLLARRVNHPNLCPIYDIFRCEQPAPAFLFLTMKLLGGESLECRLKRHEEIPLEEAVQICGQLLEGIRAIHGVGIIHRDIKPNNVMLEPSASGTCVTIMDFGLARLSEAGATLSRTGLVAGTPGYLAPELIRGASPSEATDLYALGVVMHQVLTGDRPMASRSGRAATVSPRLHLAKAPAGLVHAVQEFLSEDPERRCRAFERMVQPEGATDRPGSPLLTRRRFALGGAAALGCLGAGAVWKWHEIDDLLHPLPEKRFVALLNWPPPKDAKVTPMVLGLIDTMMNTLSRAEAFDHNFYVACQTSLTQMKTPAQVTDVCESLGANLILATSGSIAPEGISVSLQVLSAGSAKVLRSRNLHVPTGEQFTLPKLATQTAARLLNVSTPQGKGAPNQVGTEKPDALAAFQAAEALLKEPNYAGLNDAIEKYKLAVDADPQFANAHARLAYAYLSHFYWYGDTASLTLARANIETALGLDPDCIEAHSSLAHLYEATGDETQALSEIAKALAPDPSNSRVAMDQAQIYFAFNRWNDAENSFKRVLKARPNYWLAYNDLANNYGCQGKFKQGLEAFQAASVLGPKNAQPVAGAGMMLFLLGDLDRADAAVSKSLSLSPIDGAFQVRADILRVRNKFNESRQSALQAIDLFPGDSTSWLRLGDAYARMKHHEKDALESYKQALSYAREGLQINPNDGSKWMLAALYQCKLGDRAGALASMSKVDEKKPVDIYYQMYKVRILELLQRRTEALSALALCVQMGATLTLIKSTNDLEALLSDPAAITLMPSSAQQTS